MKKRRLAVYNGFIVLYGALYCKARLPLFPSMSSQDPAEKIASELQNTHVYIILCSTGPD